MNGCWKNWLHQVNKVIVVEQKQDYSERRQSERQDHRGYGTLTNTEGSWPVCIINISMQGALIAILEEHSIEEGMVITLQVELANGSSVMMHGSVAHVKEHYVGLDCKPNDDQEQSALEALLREMGDPV